MQSPSFEWNNESVAELRRLWCEKGVSAGVAAQLLSEKFSGYVTRNMIIGKAHRLGLKHPEGKISVKRRQKKKHFSCQAILDNSAVKNHPAISAVYTMFAGGLRRRRS